MQTDTQTHSHSVAILAQALLKWCQRGLPSATSSDSVCAQVRMAKGCDKSDWQRVPQRSSGSLTARLKAAGFPDIAAKCQKQALSQEELSLARAALASATGGPDRGLPRKDGQGGSGRPSSSRSRRRSHQEAGKGGPHSSGRVFA